MAYRPAQVYTGSGWDDIGDKRMLTHDHSGGADGANIPQSSVTDLTTDLASKANYPTGGSNGDLLTKSGTTTAWATPPSLAGMVLITSETFSAVSSVSANGCFTSSYENYLVKLNVTAASTTNTTDLRLRASGSDNSSSVYSNATYSFRSGNAAAVSTANEAVSQMSMIAASGSARHLDISIFRPQVNARTSLSWTGVIYSASSSSGFDSNALWGGGTHNSSYQADGFTIITGLGTITGKLRIYGYKD